MVSIKKCWVCFRFAGWIVATCLSLSAFAQMAAPTVDATPNSGSYTVTWPIGYLQEKAPGGTWQTISGYVNISTPQAFSGQFGGTWTYRYFFQFPFPLPAGSTVISDELQVVVSAPPGTPATLTTPSLDGDGAYTVSWSGSPTATSYTLQKQVNSGSWTTVQSTNATSYNESGLGNGHYSYRVNACESSYGCSAYSGSQTTQVLFPPATPTGLTAPSGVSNSSVALSWNSAANASTYTLERLTFTSTSYPPYFEMVWLPVYSGPNTSFTDTVPNEGVHPYQVKAVNATAESAYSTSVSVTYDAIPDAPGNLSVDDPSYVGEPYAITWETPAGVVTYYQLENTPPNASPVLIYSGADTTFDATELARGHSQYRVRACNNDHCGPYSGYKSTTVEELFHLADEPVEITGSVSPGSLDYSMAVTTGGSATVNVPLVVPPGVNGLQPTLALAYSSGSGGRHNDQGLPQDTLGYGWHLSGFAAIQTCKAGTANGAIETPTDHLCLDGEPLVPVSGSQFATDTVYRTQKDNFVLVTQKHNGSHAWFDVQYPDGRRAQFGNTTDSYVATRDVVPTYAITQWSVNQITDAFGNTMSYSYNQTYGTDGTHYPLSISYDNTTVSFYYTSRDDVDSSVPLALLHTIEMRVGGTLVRDYRLLSETELRRRLHKVQQCGYSESGFLDTCLPTLRFDWIDPATPTDDFKTGIALLTDGLGATTQIDYALLSAPGSQFTEKPFGNYSAPANAAALTTDKHVATALHRANGIGGLSTTRYAYSDVGFNSTRNWGFLGFYSQRIIDDTTNRVTYLQRRLDNDLFYGELAAHYQFIGTYPTHTAVLSQVQNHYAAHTIVHSSGQTVYPYHSRRTQLLYEDNVLLGAVDTTTTPTLASGLLTAETVTTRTANGVSLSSATPAFWGDWPIHSLSAVELTTVETTTFTNRTSSQWLIGFPASLTKTHYQGEPVAGVDQVVQHATFTPHPSALKIASATRFPGDAHLALTTTYGYDSHGNTTSTTVSGANVPSRTRSASNLLHKRYPQTLSNANNHITTVNSYDLRFGSEKQITDPNIRVVSEVRNGLGRLISRTNADGVIATTTYEPCSPGGCGSVGGVEPVYRVGTSSPITPQRFHYIDSLGRVIRIEVVAFAGATVRRDTHYDNRGRVDKHSQPYFIGEAPHYVVFTYDDRDRVISELRPDGGSSTTTYSVDSVADHVITTLTDTVKNATGAVSEFQVKRNLHNVLGQLMQTTDAYGSSKAASVSYTYNPQGLIATSTAEGATSTFAYDAAGHRTSFTGPNMGTVTTTYTALGQIDVHTDNAGATTAFGYDVLGRTISRTDISGLATWTWDTAPNAIGLLQSRTLNGFTESYVYNTNSRVSHIQTTISVPGYTRHYTTEHTYDSAGRQHVTHFASGFAIKRAYNTHGYLSQLSDDNTGAVLQTFTQTDAFGNLTDENYGNTIATHRSFDPTSGRLTDIDTTLGSSVVQNLHYAWRTNHTLESRTHNPTAANSNTVKETLTYDVLNRVEQARTYLNGTYDRDRDYQYNTQGNLLSKTSTETNDVNVTGYQYATTSQAGPHAVSQATVSDADGPGTVTYTLHYNANGAIVHYDANTGPDKFITYNAVNQPKSILVGTSPTDPDPVARDEFYYGPDGARYYKKSRYQENGQTKTSHTFYLGDYENILIDNDPTVVEVRKTTAGDIMQVESIDPLQIADIAVEYLHRDHLGSVDTVTDSSGTILQVTAFEPFGERKDSDWRRNIDPLERDQLLQALNIRTSRGFTGHEHLDHTGFIHMNGRLYDPTLGRFVSPDPVVQSPTHSQNWNRYSYVVNSPLSFTDPTGYQFAPIHVSTDEDNTSYHMTYLSDIQWRTIAILTPSFSAGFGGGGFDGGGGGGFGMSYSFMIISIPIPVFSTETILKPEYTSHAGLADQSRAEPGPVDGYGKNEHQLVKDIANGLFDEFILAPAKELAVQKEGGTELWVQTKAFVKGVISYPKDVIRTTVTGASVACEGFSSACAQNVENSRRIGRALYDYNNDPKVREQVDLANKLSTQAILNDPVIQSQVAGRAAVATIVGTSGVVGMGLNIMAITGGALRGSEAGGNFVDSSELVRGALGVDIE